ncbi:hypothetical protein BH20ACI4_BH20ACI4_34910 [soil metagenome]
MLYKKIFIWTCFIALTVSACSNSAPKPKTPLETLQTYAAAYKKKDYTTMKLLLSDATIKMHQQSAKDQNVTLDDIVERETLFLPEQKTAEFRNQKTDGDKASIEMKDSGGIWNTVNFVREESIWKLDKQSFAIETIEQNEQKNQALDELINQGKQP